MRGRINEQLSCLTHYKAIIYGSSLNWISWHLCGIDSSQLLPASDERQAVSHLHGIGWRSHDQQGVSSLFWNCPAILFSACNYFKPEVCVALLISIILVIVGNIAVAQQVREEGATDFVVCTLELPILFQKTSSRCYYQFKRAFIFKQWLSVASHLHLWLASFSGISLTF